MVGLWHLCSHNGFGSNMYSCRYTALSPSRVWMESGYLAATFCSNWRRLRSPCVHFHLNFTIKTFFDVWFFAFFLSGGNVWSELVCGVNKHRFHHCCRAARVAWVNKTHFKDTVHKYARWLVTVAHVMFRGIWKTWLNCMKRAVVARYSYCHSVECRRIRG